MAAPQAPPSMRPTPDSTPHCVTDARRHQMRCDMRHAGLQQLLPAAFGCFGPAAGGALDLCFQQRPAQPDAPQPKRKSRAKQKPQWQQLLLQAPPLPPQQQQEPAPQPRTAPAPAAAAAPAEAEDAEMPPAPAEPQPARKRAAPDPASVPQPALANLPASFVERTREYGMDADRRPVRRPLLDRTDVPEVAREAQVGRSAKWEIRKTPARKAQNDTFALRFGYTGIHADAPRGLRGGGIDHRTTAAHGARRRARANCPTRMY